jgi:hypothetical protein
VRALAIVAAAASVLLVSGCASPVATPAGPTAYEELAVSQAQLDATWELTGLEGTIERPDYRVTAAVDAWREAVTDCLAEDGIEVRRIVSDGDGYRLMVRRGYELDDATQFLWYRCFAHNPPSAGVASAEQLAYLWDYYARWVIPCITDKHYELNRLPTRDQFLATRPFQWTPYGALTDTVGDTEYSTLVAQCGPEFGIIER